MNLLLPMPPQYQSRDDLHTTTQTLADEPTLGDGPPVPEQRCLEYQYTKLDRWTYFISTQYFADELTLPNRPPKVTEQRCLHTAMTYSGQEWQFHYCYWHLVVKNGNFTLLLTSSDQEAISHCYWHLVVKNGNFTLLLTSSVQEWQFHIATDI